MKTESFFTKEKRMEYTARRQRICDLCAVFLFLLLLPYGCSLVFGEKMEKETGCFQNDSVQEIRIRVGQGNGSMVLEMEEYLIGALAASIPADCEAETLKAHAVILRTMCLLQYEKQRTVEGIVDIGREMQKFLNERETKRSWGKKYQDNLNRIRTAVKETAGIYMTYEGRIPEPAYFYLSAGKTRNGTEVLGEEYAYLTGVECPEDMWHRDALGKIQIKEDSFWHKLGLEKQAEIFTVRDSAGYVLWVEIGEEKVAGETFKNLFGVRSSHFSIQIEGDLVTLNWKGNGHGLGFCQYDANRRARTGMDYEELLKIYFQGIELRKRNE